MLVHNTYNMYIDSRFSNSVWPTPGLSLFLDYLCNCSPKLINNKTSKTLHMKQFKLVLHQAVLNVIGAKSNVYYFYHDWTTEKENKLHRGNCEYCDYGMGSMPEQARGENGVWIGPFDS